MFEAASQLVPERGQKSDEAGVGSGWHKFVRRISFESAELSAYIERG